MNFDSNFLRLIFFTDFALELAIAAMLFRRQLHLAVTWFSIYIGYQILSTPILYWTYQTRDPYNFFYYSWISQGVTLTLSSMFILEAIRQSLSEYEAVRKVGGIVLLIAVAVLISFAIATVPYGSDHSIFLGKVVLVSERSLRIVQVGTILTFFAFCRYVALNWDHYLFGILVGYGLYGCVDLAVMTYTAQFGAGVAWKTTLINSCAYVCTLLLWLIYIFRTKPKTPPTLPPSASKDLAGWEDALTDLMKK